MAFMCPICKKNYNTIDSFCKHVNTHESKAPNFNSNATNNDDNKKRLMQMEEQYNRIENEVKVKINEIKNLCDEYNKISPTKKLNINISTEKKQNNDNVFANLREMIEWYIDNL